MILERGNREGQQREGERWEGVWDLVTSNKKHFTAVASRCRRSIASLATSGVLQICKRHLSRIRPYITCSDWLQIYRITSALLFRFTSSATAREKECESEREWERHLACRLFVLRALNLKYRLGRQTRLSTGCDRPRDSEPNRAQPWPNLNSNSNPTARCDCDGDGVASRRGATHSKLDDDDVDGEEGGGVCGEWGWERDRDGVQFAAQTVA